MSKINSRRKGHDFERANVRWWQARGWKCRRRIQPRGGGGEPELEFDDYPLRDGHYELKRYKRIGVYKWWHQALADSRHRNPRLILKADGEEELTVTSRAEHEEWARLIQDCNEHHVEAGGEAPDFWITCKNCGGAAPVYHTCGGE